VLHAKLALMPFEIPLARQDIAIASVARPGELVTHHAPLFAFGRLYCATRLPLMEIMVDFTGQRSLRN
jgi:hypothetical protein